MDVFRSENSLALLRHHKPQIYTPEEWESKQEAIILLYLTETTVNARELLAKEHQFYVTEGMLWSRMKQWGVRKYNAKTAPDGTHAPCLDELDFWARALEHARRRRPSQIQAPAVYKHAEDIFSTVSHYVRQSFDTGMWTADDAPAKVPKEWLLFLYDRPPPSLRLFGILMTSLDCFKMDRKGWGGFLLRIGHEEIAKCLRDQPYQTLPVILFLLRFIGKNNKPKEVQLLLEYCHNLASVYRKSHAVKEMFSIALKVVMGPYPFAFLDYLFAEAGRVLVDRFGLHLGLDSLTTSLVTNTLQMGSPSTERVPQWVNCRVLQRNNPDFFNSASNIEHCVVLAAEFYGSRELKQVRDALTEQLNFAGADRRGIGWHFRKLENAIGRISMRDHAIHLCSPGHTANDSDKKIFEERWEVATRVSAAARDDIRTTHLMDLFFGRKVFSLWRWKDKVSDIDRRLEDEISALYKRFDRMSLS